ncbi:Endogenous retrovirus group 3 member 1 Env polyprotein [Manis javanica]|nr:Endogenous retrovirus group 3 member 1 Env polyprotein [Manis javanica]
MLSYLGSRNIFWGLLRDSEKGVFTSFVAEGLSPGRRKRGTDPGTLLHIKWVNMEEFRHLRIKDTEKRSTLQTGNWKDDEWPPEHIIYYHRPATQAKDGSYG